MFCVASPHDRSDFRSNPPQRKVAFALAACLTSFLFFASFAAGQNIINTVAGNYVATTTPTGADIPGPTARHPGFARATSMLPQHPILSTSSR